MLVEKIILFASPCLRVKLLFLGLYSPISPLPASPAGGRSNQPVSPGEGRVGERVKPPLLSAELLLQLPDQPLQFCTKLVKGRLNCFR
jgi:hypothetical protein